VNNSLEIFEILIPEHPELDTPDVSLFKTNLTKQLHFLLEKDTATLWNGLYRIDISENKVKEAFKGIPDSGEIAQKLCELIIERLIQKMNIRRKYSSNSDLDESL
jgi:putative methionine-R-sulfoxide reductase with GAF domain